ncbi:hypothetical protein AWB85_08710 [Mycobacteroides immunogenum]|uniref:Uncharacterized protein n=1 Tax=Mycobacteroides immunogenum TaxID=83262 RepID=A0A179V7Q1_9MYCO|nr:hypothetical protein [Mycobacteroides immunogenum]OAT67948.1 hypothetical protein AWB85_08710 [Mycobacteroides immunogenum]
MSALRDLSVWLPALEAQLRDAPGGVDLVEFGSDRVARGVGVQRSLRETPFGRGGSGTDLRGGNSSVIKGV